MTTTTLHTKFGKGFTIVELLIVIVVVGILATIVLVSYQGSQAYANSQSAQASASSLQRKIEAYAEEKNTFPDGLSASDYKTEMDNSGSSDTAITTAGLTIGTPSTINGTTTLKVSQCATAPGNGYKIEYWDFSKKALSTNVITGTLGSTTCSSWTPLT